MAGVPSGVYAIRLNVGTESTAAKLVVD
jgi:hypothetical protein